MRVEILFKRSSHAVPISNSRFHIHKRRRVWPNAGPIQKMKKLSRYTKKQNKLKTEVAMKPGAPGGKEKSHAKVQQQTD